MRPLCNMEQSDICSIQVCLFMQSSVLKTKELRPRDLKLQLVPIAKNVLGLILYRLEHIFTIDHVQ